MEEDFTLQEQSSNIVSITFRHVCPCFLPYFLYFSFFSSQA